MAFIDDIYIFVEDENVTRDMEVSSHSVEEGLPFTDTVKQTPTEISLTGEIVDYPVKETRDATTYKKASAVLSQIEAKRKTGALITYSGRNYDMNMQIKSFSTGHNNQIAGGASFSMTLQKCRIVSNAYVAPKDSSVSDGGNQQVDKGENEEVYYTVKKGDCVANLVAEPKAPYKNLNREGAESGYWGACNWVMKKNPKAFSRPGDFRTLQIAEKILLGTR